MSRSYSDGSLITEAWTASQSSYEVSVRPSREAWSENDHIRDNIGTLSSPSETRTSLQVIINLLRTSGLPGPVLTTSTPTGRNRLGQGVHFAVYQEQIIVSPTAHIEPQKSVIRWDVAVKQPKVGPGLFAKPSLADRETQKKLQSLWLEIVALTDPQIQRHPNIVNLRAWTSNPLMLVMDLAKGDLETVVRSEPMAFPSSQRYSISLDIASGLDKIHECGLIHGDLKPGNILLFEQDGRYIAKLADFGLCIPNQTVGSDKVYLGGTPGWQAPEVEASHCLDWRNLVQADTYSFGLVVWSIFLHSGAVPPRIAGMSRQVVATEDMTKNQDDIHPDYHPIIHKLMQRCLCEQPAYRPVMLLESFSVRHDQHESLFKTHKDAPNPRMNDDIHVALLNLPNSTDPFRQEKEESWEPDAFADDYAESLHGIILQNPGNVPSRDIFALFLHLTNRFGSYSVDERATLHLLIEAAKQGSTIAQSMVHIVHNHYKSSVAGSVQDNLRNWLENAVSEGSALGKRELKLLDAAVYEDSVSEFHKSGGYSQMYFDNDEHYNCNRSYESCGTDPERICSSAQSSSWTRLHHIATYGTINELHSLFDGGGSVEINTPTAPNKETALYLAFARGFWPMAKELLRRGADPSIPCTSYGITCLHWLFAFEDNIQQEVIAECICRGADVNAKVARQVPFHHYPFVLPAGSPLHWAIATNNQGAIEMLYDYGASLDIRDDSDPYAFDGRVRLLDRYGGQNLESYSIPEVQTMGLSALDLSAQNWDPYIFRLLLQKPRSNVNINTTDEEGFTILHHLSADGHRRTRLGNIFSMRIFQGSVQEARRNILEIVSIAQQLGANLDQLTTTTTSKTQSDRPSNFTNRSPLMLAVNGNKVEVIEALLQHGADVNLQNEANETALFHIGRGSDIRCVELLIQYGVDLHHRCKGKPSSLLHMGHWPEAVDLLLSRGANIEETYEATRAYESQWNVWFYLAEDNDLLSKRDKEVEKLLQKHLFSRNDPGLIERVVGHATAQGETMLHRFARKGMLHCVTALLKRGADPNPLFRNNRFQQNSRQIIARTPLDLAGDRINQEREDVERSRIDYSREEFEAFCNLYETVIRRLREFGGTSSKTLQI